MLGVTTAGPSLLAQASSPANKVLRSGVSILPMHKRGKGACDRKAATIKVHMRVTKMSYTPFLRGVGGQFAFIKHFREWDIICVLHLSF